MLKRQRVFNKLNSSVEGWTSVRSRTRDSIRSDASKRGKEKNQKGFYHYFSQSGFTTKKLCKIRKSYTTKWAQMRQLLVSEGSVLIASTWNAKRMTKELAFHCLSILFLLSWYLYSMRMSWSIDRDWLHRTVWKTDWMTASPLVPWARVLVLQVVSIAVGEETDVQVVCTWIRRWICVNELREKALHEEVIYCLLNAICNVERGCGEYTFSRHSSDRTQKVSQKVVFQAATPNRANR